MQACDSGTETDALQKPSEQAVKSTSDAVQNTTNEVSTIRGQTPHPGKKLVQTKCFFCHSSDAPEHGRIAPPMIAVKAHYIDGDTTKEEFIAALQNFLEKPAQEKSKMPGAIRRYGLMPYQNFEKDDISQIGEYLYDYQIGEPDWFKQHWEERFPDSPYTNTGKQESTTIGKTPEDIGLEYALGTKKELGKNLMQTIQKQGTLEAVKFCNEQAFPLTAAKAQEYQASIKRVSDKPRNPANQANAQELQHIAEFKNAIAQGKAVEPIVVSDSGQHNFYYPIITNSMCLQCHGSDIKPDVLEAITELYPEDKAQGYDVDQVRGIWSIEFTE